MPDPEFDDHAVANQILYNKDGDAVGVIDDAGTKRLQVEAKLIDDTEDDRQKVVHVDFRKEGIAASTYFLLIDLDGASYKHDLARAFLKVGSIVSQATKDKSGAKWRTRVGLILRIDGTDADIGWVSVGLLDLRDSSRFTQDKSETGIFPLLLDLQHAAGAYDKIASAPETGIAAVNTGVTLEDAFGANVTPAVGDLVLYVEQISGTGVCEANYNVGYFAED